jgi:hypothetical protein
MLAGPDLARELFDALVVGRPDQQWLDDPVPADGGLDLGVGVDVVRKDQPATPPVGMHDAILIHRTGDGVDEERSEGQVLTGRLALPQLPVGVRDVDLHQTVDDVPSLGGGEQVV